MRKVNRRGKHMMTIIYDALIAKKNKRICKAIGVNPDILVLDGKSDLTWSEGDYAQAIGRRFRDVVPVKVYPIIPTVNLSDNTLLLERMWYPPAGIDRRVRNIDVHGTTTSPIVKLDITEEDQNWASNLMKMWREHMDTPTKYRGVLVRDMDKSSFAYAAACAFAKSAGVHPDQLVLTNLKMPDAEALESNPKNFEVTVTFNESFDKSE